MSALRKHKLAICTIFGLFALWGVARCLYDTLVLEFAKAFAFAPWQLILTQYVYALLYFLFAVPAAIYARAFGSKAAIVFGLGTWCVGAFLFYPAAQGHALLLFALAAVVMYLGYIFVELSINPIIAAMGPPERAPLRLNFAHAIYPIGIIATLYAEYKLKTYNLALPINGLAKVVLRPYMVIGIVVLLAAFLVDKTRYPSFATERGSAKGISREFRTLVSRPMFRMAMAAQFCAVTAMTATWPLGYWYICKAMPGLAVATIGQMLFWSLIIFAVARFIGAFLMLRYRPEILLALFSLSGLVLGGIATLIGGSVGVYCWMASNVSMAILFATVLGIAIKDLGPLTKSGTALLYIAGSAGVIGVAAMHLLFLASSSQLAMTVPTLAYAGVLMFALAVRKRAVKAAVVQAD